MTRKKTVGNQTPNKVDPTTLENLFLPSRSRPTSYIKKDVNGGYRLQMRVHRNPAKTVAITKCYDYELLEQAVEALLTARYAGNLHKTLTVVAKWRLRIKRVTKHGKGWKLSYKGMTEVFRNKSVAFEGADLMAKMYVIDGKSKRDVMARLRDLRIQKDFIEGEAA